MCCSLPHGFHLPSAGSSSHFSLLFSLVSLSLLWTSFSILYFILLNSHPCTPSVLFHSRRFTRFVLNVRPHDYLFHRFLSPIPPYFALQFCALFPTASPTPPPSFPVFLHMSWRHRCVPNVPQTLFSTIKLLSLLSPAAARITWAEGALFKYRAAPGRRKTRVWGEGEDGRKRKKRKETQEDNVK